MSSRARYRSSRRRAGAARVRGFTLVELAIVTAIIGLLVAGAVASFGALRINTKIKETNRNLASAELLLQAFVARNGRLPCPADPTLAADDTGYAREASAGGPGGGCDAGQAIAGTGLFWGTLPALDLGAQPRAISDGWDNQLYFVVVGSAALTGSLTNGVWSLDDGSNEIELWDKADDDASLPARSRIVNQGVAALISAGPNGSGAYTLDGARLPLPVATALAENDNQDADIFLAAREYSEDAATPFDDIVRVYTEDDLLLPLAAMDEVQTKRALTLERLQRIEDVIYGFVAIDATSWMTRNFSRRVLGSDTNADGLEDSTGDGTVPWLDFDLSQAEVQDAWGRPIRYDPQGLPATLLLNDIDGGLWSGSPNAGGLAFRLWSRGPDGADGGGDDIDMSSTFNEAMGRLVRAGVQTD